MGVAMPMTGLGIIPFDQEPRESAVLCQPGRILERQRKGRQYDPGDGVEGMHGRVEYLILRNSERSVNVSFGLEGMHGRVEHLIPRNSDGSVNVSIGLQVVMRQRASPCEDHFPRLLK